LTKRWDFTSLVKAGSKVQGSRFRVNFDANYGYLLFNLLLADKSRALLVQPQVFGPPNPER
jgi:hypothetical protein